jgi:hypothetical protein
MADNIFENNIVYAGPRCLIVLTKSQVERNQLPATIDHSLYYCVSGPQASTWAGASATVTGFDNMFSPPGMTVIPVFRTRVLLILPSMTFICDPILPRSPLARMTECRWVNWMLKAHRESNPRR